MSVDLATRELMAAATIGGDAESFLTSDLGRTVLGIARQEREEALEKLARVSFWRWKRIMQLQNEVRRAESFEAWLLELLQQGQQAMLTLEEPAED